MTIIWSNMLPRLYWNNAKSYSKIDATRKAVNRIVMHFFKREGRLVIRHLTIIFAQKQLLRYDRTNLNDLGNAALLNGLQGGLETIACSSTSMYS